MVLLSASRTHRCLQESRIVGPSWLLVGGSRGRPRQYAQHRLRSTGSSGSNHDDNTASQGSCTASANAFGGRNRRGTLLKRLFGFVGRKTESASDSPTPDIVNDSHATPPLSAVQPLVIPKDSPSQSATLNSLRAMGVGAHLPEAGSSRTQSPEHFRQTLREAAKKRLEERRKRERHRQSVAAAVSSAAPAQNESNDLRQPSNRSSHRQISAAVDDVPEGVDAADASESGGPTSEDLEEILGSMRQMQSGQSPQQAGSQRVVVASGKLSGTKLKIADVRPLREAKVARLRRGLDRVLFNPSVYFLRDPNSLVYNFDPSLEIIPRPADFAFERLPAYVTASQDKELHALAKQHNLKYYGSTSTLTAALSQIYFSISGYRPVDTRNLSSHFAGERDDFTAGARLPASLWIRAMPNGKYAIDNEKSWDIEGENVLSELGNVMEKMLTSEPKDFRRFLRSSPDSAVPQAEREERQAYRYCKASSLLMRSQLDCHDRRLPDAGTFDIKTRAAMVIRHDRANHAENSAYDIHQLVGPSESFEKEFYDMSRSAFLKYSMQVRIGGMDGIFVAYHNTARIFGFQYIPLKEMDRILHGSSEMGEQAFKHSVYLFEQILDQATAAFPGETINLIVNSNENNLTVTATPESSRGGTNRDAPPAAMFVLKHSNILDGNRKSGVVGFDRLRADKTECETDYEATKRSS